jgi:hypothetical protein
MVLYIYKYFVGRMIDQLIHRDTFLEQQQTEKIETEVRDVDIGYESRKCRGRMIDQLIYRGIICLEQQQTEKIKTEVRDVDKIRIMTV